jgi:glycosyltransferase involved in cell wall biosynthesis
LQKRYGGEIVLHGPDENIFNPELFDKTKSRKEFNFPPNKKLILFAGVPHEHKGVRTIIEAMERLDNEEFILICAGPCEHELFKEAKRRLGSKCILLGMVDNSKMPSLLSAVDITPMLQKKMKFTESQMPAKLFEAMAMKKMIIATDASDIGIVLGKDKLGKRGFLVDYDNVEKFIDALNTFTNNTDLVERMTKNARDFYLSEASVGAISKKLESIID